MYVLISIYIYNPRLWNFLENLLRIPFCLAPGWKKVGSAYGWVQIVQEQSNKGTESNNLDNIGIAWFWVGHMDQFCWSYQGFPLWCAPQLPRRPTPVRYGILPCKFDMVTTHTYPSGVWQAKVPITTGYISWMNRPSEPLMNWLKAPDIYIYTYAWDPVPLILRADTRPWLWLVYAKVWNIIMLVCCVNFTTNSSALPWAVWIENWKTICSHLKLCDAQGLHRCTVSEVWLAPKCHFCYFLLWGKWGLIIGFFWLLSMFNPAASLEDAKTWYAGGCWNRFVFHWYPITVIHCRLMDAIHIPKISQWIPWISNFCPRRIR